MARHLMISQLQKMTQSLKPRLGQQRWPNRPTKRICGMNIAAMRVFQNKSETKMKLFNRIIATLLIIGASCGVGTQTLLGNLGSKPNTSGPAVGPLCHKQLNRRNRRKKPLMRQRARWILLYQHLMSALPQQKMETPRRPELRRAEANICN